MYTFWGGEFIKVALTVDGADTAVVKADKNREKAKQSGTGNVKSESRLKKALEGAVPLSGTKLISSNKQAYGRK